MAWTLADIRNRLRTVIGLTDNDAVTDSTLNDYINSFLRYSLPYVVNPPELKRTFTMETASGVRQYGTDEDMMSIIGPVYVDGVAITFTFNDKWFWDDVVRLDPDTEDEPTTVLHFESQLFFHPIPDEIYEINTVAIARPSELVNDTDTVFKSAWGLPVVYGTAMEYFMDIGDTAQAAEIQTSYNHYVALAQRGELYSYIGRRAYPSW